MIVHKQTSGSGGFKMPMPKGKGRNLELPDDLPSKDELFSQLGIVADDNSMRAPIKADRIEIAKQMIIQKEEQINKLPPKPQTPQVYKQKVSNRLTSEQLEAMLEDHRKQMQPISQQYDELQKRGVRSKSPAPSQSQKIIYHQESVSVDKLRRSHRDLDGPHGEFVKSTMPKQKLEQFKSESKVISNDDFQKKFKNYLRNKRKEHSQHSSDQIEFDLYQSTSPNPSRKKAKHHNKAVFRDRGVCENQSQSKSPRSKSKKKKEPAMSEEQLCEQIFKQIDTQSVELIDKIQVIKYLISNPQIIEAFNINAKELNQQVNKFPTKQQGVFTTKEFTRFLMKYKATLDHEAFGGLSHVSQQQQVSSCLLTEAQIQALKSVFDVIQTDMIAPRRQLIQALRNDIQVVRMLHQKAAYVASIDRILNLDTVLSQLETQANEFPYISWKQFMDGFEYDVLVSKQQLSFAALKESQKQVDDQDKVDSPEELQNLIKEAFSKLVMDDYVTTSEIIDYVRRSPLYSELRKRVVRLQSKKGELPQETLEQLLKRIEENAEEYLTLPEFMSYFTRRGSPKFNEEVASLAKSVNVAEALQNENLIDGYDSDPELFTYQDKMIPRERLIKKNPSQQALLTYSHRKRSVSSKNPPMKEDFLAAIQPKPQYGAHSKPSDYHFRVTKPEPFNFDKREKERSMSIRERKLKEMLKEKDRENSFKSFRAKDVPQLVRQDGLYDKIMTDNERRREEVKKNSMQMTLKNERPFSFYKREKHGKARKRYWEEREQFVFKAKAIPWHVHVELLKQMEQDEETKRQERIAKHAQQLAMSSRMPPRMEMHERQKSGQPKSQKHATTQVVYQAKPIPDFDKLHSTFQDQLNRKKLQMRTTEPQPFNFQQSHKGVDRPYLDQSNEKLQKVDPIEEARKKMSVKPIRQPPATKKWESNCEFLKKQRMEKIKKQEEIKKEDEERLARKEKFKQRVQQSEAIHDNSKKLAKQREERIAQLKKEQKEQEMKQKKLIEDCKKKASEQPLLVERPTKRDVQMEKMKQLSKIDKMLKENGVVKREEYFNKEEKAMLDDINYLKKHGYEEDFEKE